MKIKLLLSSSILSAFLTFLSITSSASVVEKPNLPIIIDGVNSSYGNAPIIVGGRTLLPLREIATKVGVPNNDKNIRWNPNDRSITLIKEKTTILLRIEQKTAYVNNSKKSLDVAPIIYKDRTYIPIKFVSEFLGMSVYWNDSPQLITITSKKLQPDLKKLASDLSTSFSKLSKYKVKISVLNVINNNQKKSTTYSYAVNNNTHLMYITTFNQSPVIEKEFFMGDLHYKKQPYSEKWIKRTINNYEKTYNQNLLTPLASLKFDEPTYSAFNLRGSIKKDSTISLASDYYLNRILEKMGLISYHYASKVSTTIQINNNEKLITKIAMDVSYANSSTKTYIDIEYSDFNGAFEISLPGKNDIL